MKVHSAEWFNAKIEETRRHIQNEWPQWMKETSILATASFPSTSTAVSQQDAEAKPAEQVHPVDRAA